MLPPPPLTPSGWAEKYRILAKDEAEPGPWRNSRTPYLIEIMDRLGPGDSCREVVFVKATQLGGTEIGLNVLGYWIHQQPGRILLIQPTEAAAKEFAKTRFRHIRGLQQIAHRFLGKGETLFKPFLGGTIKFGSSLKPTDMASLPCRYVFGDEVDRWALDCGGEGDPADLAERRLGTFPNGKLYFVSTPTDELSRIWARFEGGDQRHFYVPCLQCGHKQILKWRNFVIPKNEDGEYLPFKAHMVCELETCGATIQNHHKEGMLALGEWRPHAPYNGRRRSYHLSGLYSPVGWRSWGDIASIWLDAQGDPIKLKTFINTILGERWLADRGISLSKNHLYNTLRRDFDQKRIPAAIGSITAGVDIQGNRIEVEIVGWGKGYESWSLDYVIIPGDPTGLEIWEDLDAVLRRTFTNELGDILKIDATCVDSGHEAHKVYAFVKKKWSRRVWAIKGAANDESGNEREIWPQRWGRNKKKDVSFKRIGVDTCKKHIYARLAQCQEPGPGFCHVPKDRPLWWFEQLTAERKVTQYRRGRRIYRWEKDPSSPNEALDVGVYAYAALIGLEQLGRSAGEEAKKRIARRKAKPEVDALRKTVQAGLQREARDDFFPDVDWF